VTVTYTINIRWPRSATTSDNTNVTGNTVVVTVTN